MAAFMAKILPQDPLCGANQSCTDETGREVVESTPPLEGGEEVAQQDDSLASLLRETGAPPDIDFGEGPFPESSSFVSHPDPADALSAVIGDPGAAPPVSESVEALVRSDRPRALLLEIGQEMVLAQGAYEGLPDLAQEWAWEHLFSENPELVRDMIRESFVQDLELRLAREGHSWQVAQLAVATWINTQGNISFLNTGIQRVIDTHRPVQDLPLLNPLPFPEEVSAAPEQAALATAFFLQHRVRPAAHPQIFPLLNAAQASETQASEAHALHGEDFESFLRLDPNGRWTFVETNRVREVLWINLQPTWSQPSIADVFLSPPLEEARYTYTAGDAEDRGMGVHLVFDPATGHYHKMFGLNPLQGVVDDLTKGLYAHEIVLGQLELPGAEILALRPSYVSDDTTSPGYEMQGFLFSEGWQPLIFKRTRVFLEPQDSDFTFEEEPDWTGLPPEILERIQKNIRFLVERLASIGWSQGDGIQVVVNTHTGAVALLDWESFEMIDQERFALWRQYPELFEPLSLESLEPHQTLTARRLLSLLDEKILAARERGGSGNTGPSGLGPSSLGPAGLRNPGASTPPLTLASGMHYSMVSVDGGPLHLAEPDEKNLGLAAYRDAEVLLLRATFREGARVIRLAAYSSEDQSYFMESLENILDPSHRGEHARLSVQHLEPTILQELLDEYLEAKKEARKRHGDAPPLIIFLDRASLTTSQWRQAQALSPLLETLIREGATLVFVGGLPAHSPLEQANGMQWFDWTPYEGEEFQLYPKPLNAKQSFELLSSNSDLDPVARQAYTTYVLERVPPFLQTLSYFQLAPEVASLEEALAFFDSRDPSLVYALWAAQGLIMEDPSHSQSETPRPIGQGTPSPAAHILAWIDASDPVDPNVALAPLLGAMLVDLDPRVTNDIRWIHEVLPALLAEQLRSLEPFATSDPENLAPYLGTKIAQAYAALSRSQQEGTPPVQAFGVSSQSETLGIGTSIEAVRAAQKVALPAVH